MDATCPRCGRGRVGAFRFCLACGFDYEPRSAAARPGSADPDPEPARPAAAIPIETPSPRLPTSVTAAGTPVRPVATPAGPAAIASPPSDVTASTPSMPAAPAPVAEAPPPLAEPMPPTPPWSMPVESFDAIDPAAERAAPPDRAPVLTPTETRTAPDAWQQPVDTWADPTRTDPGTGDEPSMRADADADDDDDIALGAFLAMLVLGGAFLVAVFFAAVQFLV